MYPSVPDTTRKGNCKGNQFSFYSRHKEVIPESQRFPGPGTYEPRRGFVKVSKSTPEFSIGFKRTPRDLDVKPGMSQNQKKMFTFKPRFFGQKNKTPTCLNQGYSENF